jgi:hypothetical protein
MLKEEDRRFGDLDEIQEWQPRSFFTGAQPASTFAASSLAFSRSDTLLSFFSRHSGMSFEPTTSLQAEMGGSPSFERDPTTRFHKFGKVLRVTGGEWYEQRPSSEPCGTSSLEAGWNTEEKETTRLCNEGAQTHGDSTFLADMLQNEVQMPLCGRPPLLPGLPELGSSLRRGEASDMLPRSPQDPEDDSVPPEEIIPVEPANMWESLPAHEVDDEQIEAAPDNMAVPTIPAEEVEENLRPCLDLQDSNVEDDLGLSLGETANSLNRSLKSSRPSSRRGPASSRRTSIGSVPDLAGHIVSCVDNTLKPEVDPERDAAPVELIEIVAAGAESLTPVLDEFPSDPVTSEVRQQVALAMLKASTEGSLMPALQETCEAQEAPAEDMLVKASYHPTNFWDDSFTPDCASGLQLADVSESEDALLKRAMCIASERKREDAPQSILCDEVLNVLVNASVNGKLEGVLETQKY